MSAYIFHTKFSRYAGLNLLCDVFFAVFAVVWMATRMGIYPTWILYSTAVEAPQIIQMFPAYYIFNGLFTVLLVLHVNWTYYILRVVYRVVTSGDTGGDDRSDTEENDDGDDDSDSQDEDQEDGNRNRVGKKRE